MLKLNGLEHIPPGAWDFDYSFWLQWSHQQRRRQWWNFWRLAGYRGSDSWILARSSDDNSRLDELSSLTTFSRANQMVEGRGTLLLGGVKLPTGDSALLNTPDPALPEGIGGHDLALGSGSYDGLVGTGVYDRWNRLFASANVQYAIRSKGDFQHQYATTSPGSAVRGCA